MRSLRFLTALLAPLATLAAPNSVSTPAGNSIEARQTQAQFCTLISPAPSANETEARFNKFANAFLVKKNLTDAFSYIHTSYINHNPAARNGAQNALNVLGPIWPGLSITVLRTKFNAASNTSWLNYRTSSFGEVVDRYRWDSGCIMEHWDQGEKFPA